MGASVAVGASGAWLLRGRVAPLTGERIESTPSPVRRQHIIGGAIFGVGWAVATSCPGPLVAQIGAGRWMALVTLAGALGGIAARRALAARRRGTRPARRLHHGRRSVSDHIVQRAGDAELTIDLEQGGRIASLTVGDLELVASAGPSPVDWGCYPMAPFAGRVRHARFEFAGSTIALPANDGDHAMHGTVLLRPWSQTGATRFETTLGDDWPWPGRCIQDVVLEPGAVEFTLAIHADGEPFPATAGWHPWFPRRLARGDPGRIHLEAGFMELRDEEGLPSGQRIPPPAGPWDDCFGDLRAAPRIEWAGALELEITSPCPFVVVYDERPDAFCVEPQTAPPNALGTSAAIVTRAKPLVARMTWRWKTPPG